MGCHPASPRPLIGPFVSGAADVAIVADAVYALEAGAGCSRGLAGTNNAILRVNADHTTTQVVDLSAHPAAHPVAKPDLADFEPDGTWYSLLAVGSNLYTAEPNHQELDRISLATCQITRLIDFSPRFPGNTDWHGPTALARHGRAVFVGTLMPFPVVVGSAQVLSVALGTKQLQVAAGGLTTVLGVGFGGGGATYVLETSAGPGLPASGTGDVVRMRGDRRPVITSGLDFPTALTVGPRR